MQLDCRNTHADRLAKGKKNGMVFHHHLDRRKNISEKINVDQVALRPDPLDSLRSRKGDRISDCHPQSLNVDRASNRGVHGGVNNKLENKNRIVLDRDIDVDKKLLSDPDRYFNEISYSKANRRLDKYLDRKNKNSICNVDNIRESKLPHYLVNVVFKLGENNDKLVPTMARLDSLADINWISKKLFLDLSSKYKIDICPCNIICKLVDKSEIKLDQCCNLELSIQMKNNSRLRISCRFVIIDSEHDLVLGYHAINRFNLMKVNIANNLKPNQDTIKIKNTQFNKDLIYLNSNINSLKLAKLNKNVKSSPSCLKLEKTYKQDINIDTFNSLVKLNTHVNRFSFYDPIKSYETRRRFKFDLKALNDKWNAYYDVHVVNVMESDKGEDANLFIDDVLANKDVNTAIVTPSEYDDEIAACKSHILDVEMNDKRVNIDECNNDSTGEKVIFCKCTNNDVLNVDNDLDSVSELVGDSSSQKNDKAVENDSKYLSKKGAPPAKKLYNCNLPSDGITQQFAKQIIANPLGSSIFMINFYGKKSENP